ncbi:serine-aspartate repeat-containing protein F isoform X2 [Melia azedarach]|uniref:Serine-aspartate repeat-containing protein F isoform X2 n=1 Tax=Melia azedarach TaxID=155640 RepID=A0ACC1YIS2_MELAZ|nr:serine-aspartate repeat-containing protein F isoform X2 [Melia azedarach]
MGNEMGNSNTSGLQEEENSTTQVEGKSVQEAGHANGEVENHIVSVAEGKDYRQKENGLASDDPKGAADPHVANRISDGGEEEGTEVQSRAESQEVEVKPDSEASDEYSETQPNSISNDFKGHEEPPVNADSEASNESSEIQPNAITNDSNDQQKPPVNADGGGENHISVPEGKDYHEKNINGFSSDVPNEAEDPQNVNQISHETEEEKTEVCSPAETPKSEIESNSAESETSDIQPTSPSKHSKDQDTPQESKLEKNLQQISDHQLEKQTSIEKEEETTKISTSETISSSDDPEPEEFEDSKFNQPELAEVLADPPIQDSNGHIHEDILGANLNYSGEEYGHHADTKISNDTDETVSSGSNLEGEMKKDDLTVKEGTLEEKVSCEDRSEIKDAGEVGDDFSEKPMIKSDLANGEIPTEISPVSSDSPREPKVSFADQSPNPHLEVSEATDNCAVLAAENILMEKEAEHVDDKPNDCPTESCEESIKESKTDSTNGSQSELLMINSVEENYEKRLADFTCNKDCMEDAKATENGHLVDEHINNQIEAFVKHSKDLQKESGVVVESERLLTKSSLTDCKREEVSEERQIVEEIGEKTKASYGIGNNTEVREAGEQCMSPTLAVEQVSLPMAPLALLQPEDNQQNNEVQSKIIQSSNDSISELKQEDYSDTSVTEVSCIDSKNLMAETLVSIAEVAIEKPGQDLSNHAAETVTVGAESVTQENHLIEECAKVEIPAFASDDYQAQEHIGRFSTESNHTQSQMQKSPSFGLDLRIQARTEESDRTPLLYQDKTAIEDFSSEADLSLGNAAANTQFNQNPLQCQAVPEPVAEKVVRMERSDSDKLKTPFLGFLKEEEEARIIVTPQKHDNSIAEKKANKESLNLQTKEVPTTSPKSREKRKARSSLFTNCMCCTTVIN